MLEGAHDFDVLTNLAWIHEILRRDFDLEWFDLADGIFHLFDRIPGIIAR
jgi:hypothetical protein